MPSPSTACLRFCLAAVALALGGGCLLPPPRITTGPPPTACLAALKAADGRDDYEPYMPTAAERALVARSLDSLPRGQHEALTRSITAIGFVYFLEDEGRCLAVGNRRYLLFDPQLLQTTASDWLSLQATRYFAPGDPWIEIAIDCGDTPAFEYALFHQAARLVNEQAGPAAPDKTAVSPAAAQPQSPIDEAPMVYRALAASPQVSLRATSDPQSDAAELATFHHLTQTLGRPYRITVRHGFPEVRVLFTYEPMQTPEVLKRLPALEARDSQEALPHGTRAP